MKPSVTIINAQPKHASEIVEIYNQGIASRIATFETKKRSNDDIAEWFDSDVAIKTVIIDNAVAGFARVSEYRSRACYAGIREYSVYVHDKFQGRRIGHQLMQALIDDCREKGIWKLLSRLFPENEASIKLAINLGFRIVGTYHKHAKLDGVWKDCTIVELSL